MATLIVKHRVANFDAWKKAFHPMGTSRRKHGWVSHVVLQDAADPNVVTIVNRVKDLAQAKAYAASPELKTAMQEAGVQGPPEIAFAEEAHEAAY
jgi:quinol monooxygenase YgiN